ncbi:MAG: hypothetical protein ACLSA2_07000 [Candidatus Gastranaerophilaceae bacterium]|nr:unknown [Clostridium sp. CAG:967]
MTEKINGVTPQDTIKIKLPQINFEPPKFESLFMFNKPLIDEPPKPTKAQELHEKWTKVPKQSGLSQEFFDEIEAMSKRLKCDAEDLAALMFGESQFKPNLVSADGKYKGLIQMTNASLSNSIKYSIKKYGEKSPVDKNMTMEKYLKLPREKQLIYAEAYLDMLKDTSGLKGKKIDGGQLWAMIKSPKNVNNKKFRDKLTHTLDSLKRVPLKYETPFSLKYK